MSKSCATSVSSTAYTYHSSQAAEDAVSWMDLPDALWHEVLKYSAVKDLLQMEQVCWRFHPSQPRQCTLGHEKKHAMKVEHPWLLIHNDLWRAQCENRWKNMPRYRLTPRREDWICQHYRERFGGVHDHSLNTQDGHSYDDAQSLTDAQDHAPLATPVSPFIRFSWKKVYFWMEEELARTTLTADELESLDWYFNFTPTAGGRGKATLRQCIFRHGLLFVLGFPPLPYRLHALEIQDYASEDGNDDHSEQLQQQKQALLVADFPPHFVSRLQDSGEWLITNPHVTFVSTDEAGTLIYEDRGFQ